MHRDRHERSGDRRHFRRSSRWTICRWTGAPSPRWTPSTASCSARMGRAACDAELYLSGGITTQYNQFGLATDAAAGQGWLIMTNASLYMAAAASWNPTPLDIRQHIPVKRHLGCDRRLSSVLPMQLSGTSFTIQAADASSVAHNISLSGAISGGAPWSKPEAARFICSVPTPTTVLPRSATAPCSSQRGIQVTATSW